MRYCRESKSNRRPPREPLPRPRLVHPGGVGQRQLHSIPNRQPSLSQSHTAHFAATSDPAKLAPGLANPSHRQRRLRVLPDVPQHLLPLPFRPKRGSEPAVHALGLPFEPHAPGCGVEGDAVAEFAEDVEHQIRVGESWGNPMGDCQNEDPWINCDRTLEPKFSGSKVTTDGGLPM